MGTTDLAAISSLASAVAAMAKGPRALAGWLERRSEHRYTEFINAAKSGGVFPENAKAMTADDMFAILRSLELDIEGEKAELYGRLASAIALGRVHNIEKRHFIKSLQEMTLEQVERLRKAWIAKRSTCIREPALAVSSRRISSHPVAPATSPPSPFSAGAWRTRPP